MTDPTEVKKPIEVSSMQGMIDALTALFRYVTVVITLFTGFLAVFETRDIAKMLVFVQDNIGTLAGAVIGIVGICTAVYGIIKTRFRGAQLVSVAESPKVPQSIAKISS